MSGIDVLAEFATRIETTGADNGSRYSEIVRTALRLVKASAANFWVLRDEPRQLRLGARQSIAQSNATIARSLKAGEGVAGWVVQHKSALVINDLEHDERPMNAQCRLYDRGVRSIIAVPISSRGRCIGVVEIIWQGDRRSDEHSDDRQWLELLAIQSGLAIGQPIILNELSSEGEYHPMIYASDLIAKRIEIANRIAAADASVLILGESGVGKELFAEQIHLKSRRRFGPFVRVHCAALPEPLLESELFGVDERIGRFEQANGGTIFLDEIGALTPNLQAKILRILQYNTFERVGATTSTRSDVRLIAAIDRDLYALVEDGSFRHDLYYRLHVLPLIIPSLRERVEDIPVLSDYFLKDYANRTGIRIRGFSDEARQTLLSYSWPGNVRELQYVIERAIVTTGHEWIQSDDLALDGGIKSGSGSRVTPGAFPSLRTSMLGFKKQVVRNALNMNDWNKTAAAKMLKIQRTYLSRLVKDLNIGR